MNLQILFMLALLGLALVLFVKEVFPIEVTALGVLGLLLATGLIEIDQAVSGFSDRAVIAIGGLFVLGHALTKTGVLEFAAERLSERMGHRKSLAIAVLLTVAAVLSAFLSNTAVVAIFSPLVMDLCARLEVSPSRVLIPLSYAAIFGGTVTLIGTTPNLLVSSMARQAGQPAIQMFEPSLLGLVFLALGLIYVFALSPWLLPARVRAGALTRKYRVGRYLTEVRLVEESRLVGMTCREAEVNERYGINVLAILRGADRHDEDVSNLRLRSGDTLIVQGVMDDILRLRKEQGVALLPDIKLSDQELTAGGQAMAEGVVSQNSRMIGKTLKELDFRQHYGGFVLAVRRLGMTLREKIAHTPLRFSDTLLMLIPRERLNELRASEDLIVLTELDFELRRGRLWWLVLAVLPVVVTLAAVDKLEIAAGALIGAVLLLLFRIVTPEEAYRSVDWSVIFMIAAFVPIGQAIISTGTADFIASQLLSVGRLFPQELARYAMLSFVYLATALLTQLVSNNAAVIILTPIALSLAGAVGVQGRPFLMAVLFAASAAFMTPVGYQTNLMVLSPGGYRFLDYTRFGAPLNLMFWLVATLLIPRFFPF